MRPALLLCLFVGCLAGAGQAQERPYFIAYSHEMEEPDNLEIEYSNVIGKPAGGNRFIGGNIEFEYGATAWWTTELYLDGQATLHDSTIFTGFRWENRLRPLLREHWINPVIYIEFANTSADKSLREVVGHDGERDFLEPNAEARQEKERELELKLILGSNYRGWNISENIIAEKNLSREPWEFGYAVGVSRPLSLAARAHNCTWCGEKFQAGVEIYGGLGDRHSFGTSQTSHYLGPLINWTTPKGMTLSFSPQFGLNDYSFPRLYRFGVSCEINQLFSRFHRGGR